MPRTSPKIAFGLYALAIKPDATPTCSDVQTFSKVNDLKTGFVTTKPVITYEPNYWLLDGGYKFKETADANTHIGLMSLSQSDVDGNFSVPPELTVVFGSVQTSDGLTLRFHPYSVDYVTDIDVSYYNASNVLIRTDNYIPTSWEFSTGQSVSNFKKIIITFNSTNKAYRYLRLTGIDFGELTYFESADIKSARIIQEVNPLSLELPMDTLELKLFSSDAALNIIDPTGVYENLKYKQPIDVYEWVDQELIYMGQFFVDKWENTSNTEITIQAIDALGIMGTKRYMGGIWGALAYNGSVIEATTTAGALIDDLMSEIGIPYDLDANLSSVVIKGWLPICSYREALQQIAFAIGAYVTCSRSGVVSIKETVLASDLTSYDYVFTKAEKSLNQTLKLKNLVTGVKVTSHDYVQIYKESEAGLEIQIFFGSLSTGQHLIEFNTLESYAYLGVTAGITRVQGNVNYILLSVPSTQNVEIQTGIYYTDTKRDFEVLNNSLPNNTLPNILKIQDATLISASIGDDTTQRVYDYYQQRYTQKMRLFASTVAPGSSVLVDILQNSQLSGIVERIEINLTGGFVADVEIVGVVV